MMFHGHEQGVQEYTNGYERVEQRKIDDLLQNSLDFDEGGVGARKPEAAGAVALVENSLFVLLSV